MKKFRLLVNSCFILIVFSSLLWNTSFAGSGKNCDLTVQTPNSGSTYYYLTDVTWGTSEDNANQNYVDSDTDSKVFKDHDVELTLYTPDYSQPLPLGDEFELGHMATGNNGVTRHSYGVYVAFTVTSNTDSTKSARITVKFYGAANDNRECYTSLEKISSNGLEISSSTSQHGSQNHTQDLLVTIDKG